MARTILVTGATGKQGGAVVRRLLDDGWDVKALTRSPGSDVALSLMKKGVQVLKGDLNDASSVRNALKGVYGVFGVQNSWEHGVDGEVSQGISLVDEAVRAGIEYFVYTSVGSANRDTGIPHFESKWRIEQHLGTSALKSTVLRPVFFMENLLAPDSVSAIAEGNLLLGVEAGIPLQMVAVDDIGAFAAMAFKAPDQFVGKAIDLAGDELTGLQMAGILGGVLERTVNYQQIPIEQIRALSLDYALMVEWFNTVGYEADIPALRTTHPALMTFDKWALHHKGAMAMEHSHA